MFSYSYYFVGLTVAALIQAGSGETGGFRYAVNDFYGNEQSHQQNRVGNGVNGQYKVLLPDGRLQTVTYVADAGGYRAKVDYTPAAPGEATTAGLQQRAASAFAPDAIGAGFGAGGLAGFGAGGLAGLAGVAGLGLSAYGGFAPDLLGYPPVAPLYSSYSNPIFGGLGYNPIGYSAASNLGYSYGYSTPFSTVQSYSNVLGGGFYKK